MMNYAEPMRYVILISSLLFCFVSSAEVYRSVDADGNVVFSDEPTPNAEKVIIPEVQTVPPPNAGNFRYKSPQGKPRSYTLAITSPADDAAIRDNAGNISVSVSVEPRLFSGDKLVIYMDGKEVGTGTSVSLQNVDRGTHQLRAVIKDRNDRIRKSSKSVSFHMLRHFNKPGG